MIEAGKIRIGTLSDFRKQEAHRPGIGDRDEGRGSYVSEGAFQPKGDIDTPFLKMVGCTAPKTFINVGFRTLYEAHVFCLTSEPHAGGLPADYDAVIEIRSPLAFCALITRGLHEGGSPMTFVGLKRCAYEERQIELAEPLRNDEWYRKPPSSFADQFEYRAAWVPQGPPRALQPIDLSVPNLRTMVRLVE